MRCTGKLIDGLLSNELLLGVEWIVGIGMGGERGPVLRAYVNGVCTDRRWGQRPLGEPTLKVNIM